jgi:3',5'-cyclic AMP phosphodiesterase CpdA
MLLVACAAVTGCIPFAGKQDDLPVESGTSAGATRLAVIGDFGTGDSGEHAVADAIKKDDEKSGFDALVTVGDNVYPESRPKYFDEAWTKPYGWLKDKHIPVYAALGNHDEPNSKRTGQEESLLGMPGRWYTEQVGNVQLIVLDANDVTNPDQMRFLEDVLAAPGPAGAVWRVVAFHQPAYSCSRHQSTPAVQQDWVPLFERSHVDLVLNGHDHIYQRFAPIDGITYVVTGAAGSSLYEMHDCPAGTPEPAVAEVRSHYVVIETTDTELRLEAVTPDAHMFDSVTVQRRFTPAS